MMEFCREFSLISCLHAKDYAYYNGPTIASALFRATNRHKMGQPL